MGLEVTTALVALVVSLIALLIASLQLVQALFGTAEGYKRCSRSVIGSWEGLRRRYFLPSELRFEVLYSKKNEMECLLVGTSQVR